MMKAAWYERNGTAATVLTVGEIERPVADPGEVLVRIHSSGVNPADVKGRAAWPLSGPRVIPHFDGAGVIEAVGTGVDHARVGERVWLWNAQWRRPFGTAAEYIALPASQAVPLPDKTTFDTGACLGIPALTALASIRALGNIAGKTLLITGAGASVGHYATQIAKLRGARVIGTASAERQAHARGAGADFVIDYKTKDVSMTLRDLTKGAGVDGIIDIDIASTVKLVAEGALAPHGKHVVYSSNAPGDIPIPFGAMLRGCLSLQFVLVFELQEAERRAAIAELTAMLEKGQLSHTIGARFRLSEIVAAHEAVESGQIIGNVVVEP